ncbi:MAG: SirB2 family protein [Steroidobacteraceae bacterium]
MIEFYPQIKWVHVAAVLASGALFLVRGLAMHMGARWTMAAPLRYLSYGIDTVLLTAALMLATILQQYPFVHSWLTVKVLLLVVYVVLGSYALKRGRTRTVRIVCWTAALAVYATIISVARMHDPLGMLANLTPRV